MPKKIIKNNSKKPVNSKEASIKKPINNLSNNISTNLDAGEVDKARKEILEVINREGDNKKSTQAVKPIVKAPAVKPPVAKTSVSKPPAPIKTEVKTGIGRKVALAVLAVVVVFILAVGVVSVGLYRLNWSGPIVDRIVAILPFPAAYVNGSIITYNQYNHDLAALNTYYDKQSEINPDLVTKPSDDNLKQMIMDKLIKEAVMIKEAKAANITVSDGEIQSEMDKIVVEAGGQPALEQLLSELYGWTVEDFKKSILETAILRDKFQEKLSQEDSSYNLDAEKRIQDIYLKVKDGTLTFEEAADQYSEDVSTGAGGDLGFISQSDVDSAYAEAAFALEEGEMSNIVKTDQGLLIIKVSEKVAGAETGDEAVEDGEELVHAAHIFIRTKDVDTYLTEKLNDGTVYRLIK